MRVPELAGRTTTNSRPVLCCRDVSRYCAPCQARVRAPSRGGRHGRMDGREPTAAHHGRPGHPAERPPGERTAQRGRHRRPDPDRRHPGRSPTGPDRARRRSAQHPAGARPGLVGRPAVVPDDPPLSAGGRLRRRARRCPRRSGPGRGIAGRLRPAPADHGPRRRRPDHPDGPARQHLRADHLRPGGGARRTRRPHSGHGLRRGDHCRQRRRPGAGADRLRCHHVRPGQSSAQRDPADHHLGQHHRPGPRGQRPRRPTTDRLGPDHQWLPAGAHLDVSTVQQRGVLGAGEGKLWASATSGSIALLARAVDDDGEELP